MAGQTYDLGINVTAAVDEANNRLNSTNSVMSALLAASERLQQSMAAQSEQLQRMAEAAQTSYARQVNEVQALANAGTIAQREANAQIESLQREHVARMAQINNSQTLTSQRQQRINEENATLSALRDAQRTANEQILADARRAADQRARDASGAIARQTEQEREALANRRVQLVSSTEQSNTAVAQLHEQANTRIQQINQTAQNRANEQLRASLESARAIVSGNTSITEAERTQALARIEALSLTATERLNTQLSLAADRQAQRIQNRDNQQLQAQQRVQEQLFNARTQFDLRDEARVNAHEARVQNLISSAERQRAASILSNSSLTGTARAQADTATEQRYRESLDSIQRIQNTFDQRQTQALSALHNRLNNIQSRYDTERVQQAQRANDGVVNAANAGASRIISQAEQLNTRLREITASPVPLVRTDSEAGLQSMISGFGKVAAVAYTGMAAIHAITDSYDDFIRATGKVKATTISQEEFAQSFEEVKKAAVDANSDLESTAALYSNITRSTRELNLATGERINLAKEVQQALQIDNATTAEATAVRLQFNQALASGVLRGQEYNSLNEQSPRILQAIADGLKVTRGELKQMADQGQLTSEVIVTALKDQQDEINNEIAKAPKTLELQLTQAMNILKTVVGESGIAEALAGVVGSGATNFAVGLKAITDGFGAGIVELRAKLVDGATSLLGGVVAQADEMQKGISVSITDTTTIVDEETAKQAEATQRLNSVIVQANNGTLASYQEINNAITAGAAIQDEASGQYVSTAESLKLLAGAGAITKESFSELVQSFVDGKSKIDPLTGEIEINGKAVKDLGLSYDSLKVINAAVAQSVTKSAQAFTSAISAIEGNKASAKLWAETLDKMKISDVTRNLEQLKNAVDLGAISQKQATEIAKQLGEQGLKLAGVEAKTASTNIKDFGTEAVKALVAYANNAGLSAVATKKLATEMLASAKTDKEFNSLVDALRSVGIEATDSATKAKGLALGVSEVTKEINNLTAAEREQLLVSLKKQFDEGAISATQYREQLHALSEATFKELGIATDTAASKSQDFAEKAAQALKTAGESGAYTAKQMETLKLNIIDAAEKAGALTLIETEANKVGASFSTSSETAKVLRSEVEKASGALNGNTGSLQGAGGAVGGLAGSASSAAQATGGYESSINNASGAINKVKLTADQLAAAQAQSSRNATNAMIANVERQQVSAQQQIASEQAQLDASEQANDQAIADQKQAERDKNKATQKAQDAAISAANASATASRIEYAGTLQEQANASKANSEKADEIINNARIAANKSILDATGQVDNDILASKRSSADSSAVKAELDKISVIEAKSHASQENIMRSGARNASAAIALVMKYAQDQERVHYAAISRIKQQEAEIERANKEALEIQARANAEVALIAQDKAKKEAEQAQLLADEQAQAAESAKQIAAWEAERSAQSAKQAQLESDRNTRNNAVNAEIEVLNKKNRDESEGFYQQLAAYHAKQLEAQANVMAAMVEQSNIIQKQILASKGATSSSTVHGNTAADSIDQAGYTKFQRQQEVINNNFTQAKREKADSMGISLIDLNAQIANKTGALYNSILERAQQLTNEFNAKNDPLLSKAKNDAELKDVALGSLSIQTGIDKKILDSILKAANNDPIQLGRQNIINGVNTGITSAELMAAFKQALIDAEKDSKKQTIALSVNGKTTSLVADSAKIANGLADQINRLNIDSRNTYTAI